jgi:hypothetical protein
VSESYLQQLQGRKRRLTVGQREDFKPRKISKISNSDERRSTADPKLEEDDTLISTSKPSRLSRLSVDTGIAEGDISDILNGIAQMKLARKERARELVKKKIWVKLQQCRTCGNWIPKEGACEGCGRDPQPVCNCGTPLDYGARCEDCRRDLCVDWLEGAS